MSEQVVEGYRLSPQQTRLWRLSSAGNASVYRSQCAALIEGDINSARLQAAVNRVIACHEILRTSLRSVKAISLPLQVISESVRSAVSEIDLTTISEQEKAGALDLLYERAGLAGMDYQNGSALKVTLVRINDVRQVMVVSAESLWSDQRGLKNVVRDVIWEYEGKAREVDQVVQYADAAEIFNELIESEETAGGREYWGSRMGWRPIETRLFAEREGNGEFKPRVERRKVCGELSKRMKVVCESIGAGEEAAMLCLFGALIRRIGGDREIRIGVGYDGRTFDGLREAVGLYMRYLPIDISIDDDVAFSDLVKPVDASAREFYKWQNYFDWRQFLTTPGGGNGEGYFPYLFEYDAEESKYSSDSISYSIEGRYAFIDRFKLKLVCYKSGEGLTAELHYDSALYDQADMSELADHYVTLLQSAVQSPRRAVGRLEMLNERQKELILNGFNQTRREYDAGGCVHEMIRDRAERSPEAIAVVFERQAISYGELNARANRLANYLRNRGVGPEQVVGVMLSRGIGMVVGLLGVLKAGAAYLPLDVDYPKRQIAYMLQDAGAALLLTERQYNDYLLGHNAPIVYIDGEWELISQESEAAPTTQVDPQNLIYVMYTSGSTGKPKGAMLTHAGVVNCLCWMQETYMLDATDRFLMRTSLNFDPSVWELFWPLWVGAAVVIAEPQRHADATYLTRLIAEREITSAYFVPSMLSVFLNEPGLEARSSLRRVICGGESLSTKTVNHFFNKLQAELHHSYGPTETSIAATEWACRREGERLIAPLGKPLGNTQVYILNAMMQPAPIGVSGEMYIGGKCVGRGYLNRADLTADKFMPDQFSIEPGARLYETGDMARYLQDGNIEFRGRLDNQVKLRGHRIELGEIEAALSKHSDVLEVVVIVREYKPGDERLIAYVVPRERGVLTSGDLRGYVRQELPEHMTPAHFHFMEKMPLSKNGKVDRRHLPAVEDETGSERAEAVPRTSTEALLTQIWLEALSVKQIGLDHNFFDLGGHSLLIPGIRLAVKEKLGRDVSIVDFFAYPTVRSLAQRLEQMDERASGVPESRERSARQRAYIQSRRESSRKE